MKLIPNAGRTLLRSSSIWCVYAAGAFEVVPEIIPYFADYLPRWLVILTLVLSIVFRVIPQKSLSGDRSNAYQ